MQCRPCGPSWGMLAKIANVEVKIGGQKWQRGQDNDS